MLNDEFATLCATLQPETLKDEYHVPNFVRWLETKITEEVILNKSSLHEHMAKECKYPKSPKVFVTNLTTWLRKGPLRALVITEPNTVEDARMSGKLCVRVSDGAVLLSTKHVRGVRKKPNHIKVASLKERKVALLEQIRKSKREIKKLGKLTPEEWKKLKSEERARLRKEAESISSVTKNTLDSPNSSPVAKINEAPPK